MKNNPEEIPSEVFDWMQQNSFETLNNVQQDIVLRHFSKEEYNEFYFIRNEVKQNETLPWSDNKERVAIDLLDRFDEKHNVKDLRKNILNSQVVFWKAAAVFVFFLTALSYAYVMKKPGEMISKSTILTDTVYVTKEMKSSPEKIHDTVYIYKTAKEKRSKAQKEYNRGVVSGSIIDEEYDEMEVLPVSELENELNGHKNNSSKDDSLTKNYSLITL
ncbi:MAG: hypothetical protein K0S32_3434 [Bacteroidetes bacterium]|jgi:hypothetical protein|nr:hypothetical protein [Bacteroidota bacterium]